MAKQKESNLEARVAKLEARNKRVEGDKAWETSLVATCNHYGAYLSNGGFLPALCDSY